MIAALKTANNGNLYRIQFSIGYILTNSRRYEKSLQVYIAGHKVASFENMALWFQGVRTKLVADRSIYEEPNKDDVRKTARGLAKPLLTDVGH